MSEVARRLRIGRSTLYRKLDLLGLGGEPRNVQSPPCNGMTPEQSAGRPLRCKQVTYRKIRMDLR